MASSEKNKINPKGSLKDIPRCITSSVEDIPLPQRNKYTEQIKSDVSNLENGKCLKCSVLVSKEKSSKKC